MCWSVSCLLAVDDEFGSGARLFTLMTVVDIELVDGNMEWNGVQSCRISNW